MTRQHLPYQIPTGTFCNMPAGFNSLFGVIGAPVDFVTTYRSGARSGPNAIREASLMLTDGVHHKYPVELLGNVKDYGNMPLPTGNTEEMLNAVKLAMDDCSTAHMVTLGGDHSITYGILKSLYDTHGEVALVHFDAHCDTWDNHFGEKYGHGTWLYNAIEEGLVDPNNAISIGIRSPADKQSREYLDTKGGRTLTAREAMKLEPSTVAKIISGVTEGKPAYLSLDIDCLDPAYAPGTGTPEIGGLTTMWMSELLENLYDVNFIGMDCVEVAPAYDQSNNTALAAATFCWQYLSMQIHKLDGLTPIDN